MTNGGGQHEGWGGSSPKPAEEKPSEMKPNEEPVRSVGEKTPTVENRETKGADKP